MTMREAISKFVRSGDTLFLSGAQHGEPSAAIHEIVRQGIDHLTLVCCLVTTSSLLIGAGLIDRAITGYTIQDEKRSGAIVRAKAMNKLPVLKEYSHFGLNSALLAGQMGIPFMPVRCMIGSDMLKYNENIKSVECPFTGEKIGIVRAVVPDVGIIHVQRADAEGSAQKWGSLGMDQEGINASRTVVVTTEKIVDSEVIRRDPNRTIIPGFRVSAVVEQPWGAYPMHLAGCYSDDMRGFMIDSREQDGFEAYLQNFVYGVDDWVGYIEKLKAIKGEDYFDKLRIRPIMSDPITTGYERLEE
jgi:glutaconate CoA-transferase subunit A